MTATLALLSDLAGLQTAYDDAFGIRREVPDGTQRVLLAAMGFAAETDDIAMQTIDAYGHARETALVPPVVIARDDETAIVIPLTSPRRIRGSLHWDLTFEDGRIRGGRAALGAQLHLPGPFALGYHMLKIAWTFGERTEHARCTLIVAPRQAYQPPALTNGGRRWGLSLQLYALRSRRNWGIGDFTDLLTVVRKAARQGAACIGLNPLHALFDDDPDVASPYAPNSRLFLNTLYLDVEAIPDFANHRLAASLVAEPDFQEQLARLRQSDLVDYRGVAACKHRLFRLLFRAFRTNYLADPESPRTQAFRAFQQTHGETLRRFATFVALRTHGADDEEGAPPLEEIEYHEYLQWEADRQLALAQDTAKRLGMTIGLYRDLAVGTSASGAEAGSNRESLVMGAHVGAPPDLLNLKGQDWGLPPYNPARLRELAYQPFRDLLAANMRSGGALRIDHILGLKRLYWIPAGATPADGAYVNYPWDELMAVLKLESHRHCCLVIGEDLGTVPRGFSEALNAAGVLSTRVFYFEKDANVFRPPAAYPATALVSVGTHDLPTFAAYWQGDDIALRTRLDLWTDPTQRDQEAAQREHDRRAIARLIGSGVPPSSPPLREVYAVLGTSPAKLLMVQIEDVAGQIAQVNVPGTWREHPNWRVRLAQDLDALLSGSAMTALAEALRDRSDLPTMAQTGAHPDRARPPAIPSATYRLQFSSQFTFDDAARLVPYLKALGVSHIYASPWLKARAGSTHGYDVVDHNTVNPEIGGAAGLENLSTVLAEHGLGHIVDFVPNHMGVGGGSNAWWQDVLEHGRSSGAAGFFDIEWNPGVPNLHNKVLLPILGEHYGEALETGRLKLRFDPGTGTISAWYYRHRLPIAQSHYGALIARAVAHCAEPVAQNMLRRVAEDYEEHGHRRLRATARLAAARTLEQRLAQIADEQPAALRAIETVLNPPGEDAAAQIADLHALLEQQSYHLAHWAAAADEINYRRFFNINELAGIRMENPRLFARAHQLIGRLFAEGRIHGLRIDHVDGLFDPVGYCRDLQAWARNLRPDSDGPLYLLVEKILARHERLRSDWPVSGTTGYEFINQVSNVLVAAEQETAMTHAYHRFVGGSVNFEALLAESKALVMETMFRSELRVLARRLHRLAQRHWKSRDYTVDGLRQALRAIIAHFPVYRTYVGEDITAEDRRDIEWAVGRARKAWRTAGYEVLDFVRDVITADLARTDSGYPPAVVIRFARRFQQFTSPVMAKSLEDTAFYRYHRLTSLNEVGGDPRQFGNSIAAFHRLNRERVETTPHALLATATHDTKRGEDTRARIHVLSEIPQEWSRAVRRWAELNARHKTAIDEDAAPDANDEYLIYQTLVGAWPTELDRARTHDALAAFKARLKAYMTKVLREAKVHSSWDNPAEDYENATLTFIDRLLDPKFGRAFLNRFQPFQRRVARTGMLSSLTQTTLKLTSPGVPDLYQGTELWDLSLVDPDNRRPVDYTQRMALLPELAHSAPEALRENWLDGRIKFFIVQRLLLLRQRFPQVFAEGGYDPLETAGPQANRVCAFARRGSNVTVVVAVARHFAALLAAEQTMPPPEVWGDTRVALPTGWQGTDIFTGAAAHDDVAAAALFRVLPVAVLVDAAG